MDDQTSISLSPDELTLIQEYRERLNEFRHRPTHFVFSVDVDPNGIISRIERKHKADRKPIRWGERVTAIAC